MNFSISKVPYSTVPLAKRDQAFIHSDSALSPFIPFPDSSEGLRQKIDERRQFPFFRKELVLELQKQYAPLPHADACQKNLNRLLHNHTFTVTTAHQPSLFTGPLYFIYKAASCIHLAQSLRRQLPDYHFVPVFVLGAEDHDFEEINHLHLYNKTISWDIPHGGPTGALSTKGIQELIEQIAEILPNTIHTTKLIEDLKISYRSENNFAQATQEFIHRLFSPYGLIVLQMNSPALKKLAIPIFRKEIIDRPSFQLVKQQIDQLKAAGFKAQANPRELNLFYMTDDMRKRIIFDNGRFQVLDTPISWTPEKIIQRLHHSPESFSPNVITRPLYQELILPNIAYVGGGGELAYWQERHTQFKEFGISFPVLIRRNSALWVSTYLQNQLSKLHLSPTDLFRKPNDLLLLLGNQSPDLSVHDELLQLDKLYQSLAQKADLVDSGMRQRLLAQKAKQVKAIRQVEAQLHKAYKQKNQYQVNKLEKIQAKLFPNGSLQERHDNFLPIFAEYGPAFIEFLVQNLSPLDKQFLIIAPK